MPIDYSKWDDIDSDSDDETVPKPASVAQKNHSDATAAAPASSEEFDKKSKQDATGSAWNMNSWHFEETKLDEWGRARLKELLHRAPVSQYLEVDGLELDLDAKIVVREIKGDCWVHVRKGKKVWVTISTAPSTGRVPFAGGAACRSTDSPSGTGRWTTTRLR